MKPRRATFRGKHNRSKSKVFLLLYHVRHHQGDTNGRTARWIYINSGVPYSSLQARLGKWTEWGYLTRYTAKGIDGQPCWHYKLGQKGRKFIEKVLTYYAPEMIPQYLQEIRDFQKLVLSLDKRTVEYKTMKELISAIEEKEKNLLAAKLKSQNTLLPDG